MEALYRHYHEINITLEGLPSLTNSPALFIKGELSDYIKDEDLALIHHLFPNSKNWNHPWGRALGTRGSAGEIKRNTVGFPCIESAYRKKLRILFLPHFKLALEIDF